MIDREVPRTMTKKSISSIAMLLCLVLVSTAMTGCKRKKEPLVTDTAIPAQTGGGDDLNTQTIDQIIWESVPASDLQTIYFDYDRSEIRADQMAKLQANATVIKGRAANVYTKIAGNCDERGTQEYNLALGERRSLAIRETLIQLGCDANKLVTVSMGEENPVDPASNEAAWSKNRRAEFFNGTK
jgi:peptidoglycan-associated lipoprotein